MSSVSAIAQSQAMSAADMQKLMGVFEAAYGSQLSPESMAEVKRLSAQDAVRMGVQDPNKLDSLSRRAAGLSDKVDVKRTVLIGSEAPENVKTYAAKADDVSYGKKGLGYTSVTDMPKEHMFVTVGKDGKEAMYSANVANALQSRIRNGDGKARSTAQRLGFKVAGEKGQEELMFPKLQDNAAAVSMFGQQAAQEPQNEALANYMQRMGTAQQEMQGDMRSLAVWSGIGSIPLIGMFAQPVVAYKQIKMMNKMSGAMGAGAVGGPAGGMMPMAAGMTSAGAMMPMAAGMSAGGNLGGLTNFGMVGFEGLNFKMRSMMRDIASNYKDDALISMINDKGMSIEDLIAYFMAYMSEKFEEKLREKMEETALAEKRERQRDLRKKEGETKSGLLTGVLTIAGGAIGGPAGAMIGAQMGNMGAQYMDQQRMQNDAMDSAINGETKSSTILMQEIQILTQKWKQVVELYSELSKMLHDMAMSVIRKIG